MNGIPIEKETPMTDEQFRKALVELGIKSQAEAAAVLGVTLRTANGYANGMKIPATVQRFLQVLRETKYPVQKWF